MDPVNMDKIDQGDGDPLKEAGVRYWMEEMLKGKSVLMPVLMQQANGRAVIVDGRKRVEAARRLGAKTIAAYVIEELPPDRFLQLRRELNQFLGQLN